ncbi:hypothetical protein C8A05DRAFT_35910 [Staphylotrichum tortipilum]|uniref:Uncharacterized protein n=1 Tax=Staphylotrichum tortipilum TaxID=2831512 RepID=A0AAN6MHU8_9PEZI|nr:hypothetical protein C8A05DRAFT_35910 [Staphylotrichum longicolle]
MAFTWESLYSFFSPPASRNSSPSLLSSAFFKSPDSTTTDNIHSKQTDLPMPPTSAFTAAAGSVGGAPLPSPAESTVSSLAAPSERDFLPSPASPYTHRTPSLSTTSTNTTASADSQQQSAVHNQPEAHPAGPQRTNTTPATTAPAPAPPRRSATNVVALDTMSRDFPKPAHEPSLDELLARPPGKWSLGHYVKNARPRRDAAAATAARAEEEARRFEEAKRELRRAKEEIEGLRA